MLLELALFFIVFCFLYYLWFTWDYSHWKKQNVPYVPGKFPFGNVGEAILMKKTIGEVFQDIYNQFPGEGAVGYFVFGEACLLIRDPELVKTVLVRDFNKFHDNGFQVNPTVDPLFGINPFVTKGEGWRHRRNIYTPALTANKLKSMVPDITGVCTNMINYLKSQRGVDIEAKEMSSFYTMDVVAKTGFGYEGNSFLGGKEGFKGATSGEIFSSAFSSNLANLCAVFAPRVPDYLHFLRILSKNVEDFFVEMVRMAKEYRNKNGIRRNDLLQILLDTKDPQDKDKSAYNDLQLAGHCMTLFLDGNETTSILLSFVLYELAQNPEYQTKLRQEIKDNIESLDDVTYEKLESIVYLDMIISETARLHPPIQSMARLCTEDTTITSNGNEWILKKGETVTIPILALHHDPDLFPDPLTFNPERFSEENKSSIVKFSYVPFGEGPRICLGMKFGLLETKLALCAILINFEIQPKEYTTKPLELDPKFAFIHISKNGLYLKFLSI